MADIMKFNYNNKPCAITYDSYQKEFCVAIYKDEEYLFTERVIGLFHVDRFSKGQQMTAFHVANRHILKDYIQREVS